MSSVTIDPSIDQGALLTFKEEFWRLAQMSKSKLAGSPAVMYMPSKGKVHNLARIGRDELTEVDARNPKKVIKQYNLDNRQYTKKRFTATYQIDEKDDINELLKDPTSDLMKNLLDAKERTIDRQVCLAAVSPVLVGAPNEAPTSVTAGNDGVITITATGGMDYDDIQQITQNFINNEVDMEDFRGTCLAITGKENTDLMGITEFTNNDYISGRPVEEGYQSEVGMYSVKIFAGSVSGGITVPNPYLVEGSTTRKCLALAPNAIAISFELASLRVEQSADRVNSKDITIDVWIGTMRTEGVLTQILETTI